VCSNEDVQADFSLKLRIAGHMETGVGGKKNFPVEQ
jgi:hypothetical protein